MPLDNTDIVVTGLQVEQDGREAVVRLLDEDGRMTRMRLAFSKNPTFLIDDKTFTLVDSTHSLELIQTLSYAHHQ